MTARRLLLPTCAAAVLGMASDATSAPAASCTPKESTFKGMPLTTYCGPASVRFTYAGRTRTIRGGTCETELNSLTVRIGRQVANVFKPRTDLPSSFELRRNTGSAGRFPSGTASVSILFNGRSAYTVPGATGVISKGVKSITFSGKLGLTGKTIRGKVTCR